MFDRGRRCGDRCEEQCDLPWFLLALLVQAAEVPDALWLVAGAFLTEPGFERSEIEVDPECGVVGRGILRIVQVLVGLPALRLNAGPHALAHHAARLDALVELG